MIDELVRDALAAQMAADPEPSAQTWARIGAAGRLAARRRARRQRILGMGAVVVVVAIVAGGALAVAARDHTGGSTQVSVVGPTAGPVTGPAPAANVAELDPHTRFTDGSRVRWYAARTGRTDRELVVFTYGCADGFAAKVHDEGGRVIVELSNGEGNHLLCLMLEAVRVPLPAPLAGRPVFDGLSAVAEPVLDGSTLSVPQVLPPGLRAQVEQMLDLPGSPGTTATTQRPGDLAGGLEPSGSAAPGWSVCYQTDAPLSPSEKTAQSSASSSCVFDGARPIVATAQSTNANSALSSGILTQDLIRQVVNGTTLTGGGPTFEYVAGTSGPGEGSLLVTAPVAGGVAGHPASLVTTGRHDAVVWTDGATWWVVATPHGLGGVSAAELVQIAQSMRPVS